MPNFKNLTDKKFVRLIAKLPMKKRLKSGRSVIYWKCICECGNTVITQSQQLLSGHTQSCGCLQKERAAEANTKHGYSPRGKKDPTYSSYLNMKTRCDNLFRNNSHNYIDRGIGYCERWNKFENFLEDMGERPKGKSLDRIDNNGDYCKENCRWATPIEQAQNTRKNVWLECDGIKMVKSAWIRELGVFGSFINRRLKKNIPFPEIVRQAREFKAIKYWGEDLRQSDFENGY